MSLGAVGTADATTIPLVNGSFEQGVAIPGGFTTLFGGSTGITGWTVTGNSVDYISTLWQPSNGLRSVDLAGNGPGGLQQSFATIVGDIYTVAFDLAGNMGAGPVIKSLRVSAAGVSQDYLFDTTGYSFANMGWSNRSFTFTATSTTTTLAFASLDPTSSFGPVIDNVTVTSETLPVPEPSTAMLLSAGFVALAGARRSRRGGC